MKFIIPTAITDAMFVSSSVAENDAAAWNPSTAYAVGALALLTSTHSVYKRIVAGTTATSPDVDSTNWVRVGPSNRWAMFDKATGTITTAPGPLTFSVKPGIGSGVALLDVVGSFLTVTVTDGGSTTYTRRVTMTSVDSTDWFGYFFGDQIKRTAVAFTDVPMTSTSVVTVTIEGAGNVSCGTFVAGTVVDVGGTKYGLQLGIVDYSVKSTDAFGATTVTQRSYAKRMTATAYVDRSRVDYVAQRLASVRALPVVWIGSELYDTSLIYGFFKDFGIDISYSNVSVCSLTIEGLS